MSKREQEDVAFHESGHAVIARVLGIGEDHVTTLAGVAWTRSATYLARNADRETTSRGVLPLAGRLRRRGSSGAASLLRLLWVWGILRDLKVK